MQSVSYPQPSCPDDDEILLSVGLSTIGGNFSGTCFNDKATKSILQGGAPFNGNLRPIDRLGSFNNQKSPNGLWKFRRKDTQFAANLGQLFYWSPLFTKNPVHHLHFLLPLFQSYTLAIRGRKFRMIRKFQAILEFMTTAGANRTNLLIHLCTSVTYWN